MFENTKLFKTTILLLISILFVITGCSSSLSNKTDQKQKAVMCARNWKAQGYNFDPNSMTCWQMFKKVTDIRRARYWNEKGYTFDPNLMTAEEMNKKVKDIDRAKYWKERGFEFDPFSMTAQEMDRLSEELREVDYWNKSGYYYDPNSKSVFLDKNKRKKLESLATLHGTYEISNEIGIYPKVLSPTYSAINPLSSGKIYTNLGSGHWIKENIDRGKLILLEDRSLWKVDPLDDATSWLWLRMADVTVTESEDLAYPYLLVNTEDSEAVKAKLIEK